MRALTHFTGQHVSQTWTPSNTFGTSWISAFGGFRTRPGQSRSSPTPWLKSGRISILGPSVGLSEACPGIVERTFKHVGVIPTINVSFQYDWMNGRNFGTNTYLDYCFVFRHGFGNLSSSDYSPFALANFAPDRLRHFYKQKFSNLKHLSSSYAMISSCSPNCFEQCMWCLWRNIWWVCCVTTLKLCIVATRIIPTMIWIINRFPQ